MTAVSPCRGCPGRPNPAQGSPRVRSPSGGTEAEQSHREGSWVRPAPDELSRLIHDPRRRLVRDGTDLLDVVLALLNKMQEDLTQGTLPAAILWNETELETLPNGPPRRLGGGGPPGRLPSGAPGGRDRA